MAAHSVFGTYHGGLDIRRQRRSFPHSAPLQRTPKTRSCSNHIVEGYGLHTEVSLVNPTPNTAGADVVVVGPDGTTLAADHVSIGPSKRAFFSLGDLLPELEDQCGGVIYVLTNEPLFATAAIWSDAGGIASNFTPQTTSFLPAPLASFRRFGPGLRQRRASSRFPCGAFRAGRDAGYIRRGRNLHFHRRAPGQVHHDGGTERLPSSCQLRWTLKSRIQAGGRTSQGSPDRTTFCAACFGARRELRHRPDHLRDGLQPDLRGICRDDQVAHAIRRCHTSAGSPCRPT